MWQQVIHHLGILAVKCPACEAVDCGVMGSASIEQVVDQLLNNGEFGLGFPRVAGQVSHDVFRDVVGTTVDTDEHGNVEYRLTRAVEQYRVDYGRVPSRWLRRRLEGDVVVHDTDKQVERLFC